MIDFGRFLPSRRSGIDLTLNNPRAGFMFWAATLIGVLALAALWKQLNNVDASDITTVVLSAGQSNAVGGFSNFADQYNGAVDQDLINKNVFVWARKDGDDERSWMVANVLKSGSEQVWIEPTYERNGTTVTEIQTVDGQSHAGFQVARHLVLEDSDQVVGIIPTGRNGMPIEVWWDDGKQDALEEIIQTARSATDELQRIHSNNTKVSLVWWMQGENNALSYFGGTVAEDYRRKLIQIIKEIEAQSWYESSSTRMFIANHIFVKNEDSNERRLNDVLDTLNGDGSPYTCSHVSEQVSTVRDMLHFDALTLASIGDSVANKYLANDCSS